MAARVSSTSSEEMASSSEDSASEDPINIAKGRGADLKETEKAEIARTRKAQRNQAGGKKTVRGQKDPKVGAYQRVRENRVYVLANSTFLFTYRFFACITSQHVFTCDAKELIPILPHSLISTPGHLTRVKLRTVGNLTQNEACPVGHLTFLSKTSNSLLEHVRVIALVDSTWVFSVVVLLLPPQGFGPEAKTRGGIIVSPQAAQARDKKK